MSDPIDPPRWSEGGGPPGSMELVRAIARPPVLPPDLSALSRARMRRALSPPRTRWIAPSVVATAVVLGGLTLWVTHPRDPQHELRSRPTPRRAEEQLTAPDAGALGPSIPVAEAVLDAGIDAWVRRAATRRARSAEDVASAPAAAPGGWSASHAADDFLELPAPGVLVLQTQPWARVWIDGRDTLRTTPVRGLEVEPGVHRIEFRTDDGVRTEMVVDVPAGETVRIVRQLPQATASDTQPLVEGESAPEARAPEGDSPMAAAQACLARGDNACVIRALEGRARTPQEIRLLIEVYRAMGNTPRMLDAMRRFVERFPSDPRASQYRAILRDAARTRSTPHQAPQAPPGPSTPAQGGALL